MWEKSQLKPSSNKETELWLTFLELSAVVLLYCLLLILYKTKKHIWELHNDTYTCSYDIFFCINPLLHPPEEVLFSMLFVCLSLRREDYRKLAWISWSSMQHWPKKEPVKFGWGSEEVNRHQIQIPRPRTAIQQSMETSPSYRPQSIPFFKYSSSPNIIGIQVFSSTQNTSHFCVSKAL